MAPQDAACRTGAAALLVLLLLTTAVNASNGRRAVLQRSAEAYATLLFGDEFVLGARVLGKSLRDVGARNDMVVLVSRGVSEESVETLSADGWIVERISLLENPNAEDKRPARFWGVYTKLYVFNMTQYKKVVYLDADTIVVQPIEELFQCSSFCANLKHSERLNSGVMVVEPSTVLFDDMLAKVPQLYSYTGGDQGFLNSYFAEFPNAKLFDPKLSAEAREAREPRPDMERLSTYYNGDVGLYVMGNKWMFDEKELKVLHYTLGPLKPWDWWTAWLLKPVDQWHKIRLSLEESVPGVGGGSTYRNGLIVIVLTYLPIFLLAVGYRKLLLRALRGMCNGAWLGFCRQVWHKCCSGSSPIYSSLSVSPAHGISAGVSGSGNNRLPPFLVFWSVCACFAIALLSLGFAFVIVPFQVTPWTGVILVYEWTFFSFLVMFGTYLDAIYLLGRRTGASMAPSSSELSHDKSFSKGRGGKEDPAFWDLETALYELGMAGLAILIPALPHFCDVTAILPRVALMVAAGMLLVSFMTHAAGHLAIRWFILGRDDWGRTRGVSLCCGIV